MATNGGPVARVMVVHGVRLGRAWTDLGPELGERLRTWSQELLAEAAVAARRSEVDLLVFLGDLFDRSTVTPAMVEYAAAVFESLHLPVSILPGRADWFDHASPYAHVRFPANVTVVTSAKPVRLGLGDVLFGSAWTGPSELWTVSMQQVDPAIPRLILRADVDDPAGAAARLAGSTHMVTTSDDFNGDAFQVGPTLLRPVCAVGEPGPALILSVDPEGTLTTEPISLGSCLVRTRQVDVTGLDEGQLYDAVVAAAEGEPTVVRVVGALRADVLPPSLHPIAFPPAVRVDESALTYADPGVDEAERTTRGEFLRAIGDRALSPRQRHIATALGLQALEKAEA